MAHRLDGTIEDEDGRDDEGSLLHVNLMLHITDTVFALAMKSKIRLNITQGLCGAAENLYSLVVIRIPNS